MTLDWFLMDAPRIAPHEYAAWEVAKEHHKRLFLRVLGQSEEDGSELFAALEKAAHLCEGRGESAGRHCA
jgi:hypothetical protein